MLWLMKKMRALCCARAVNAGFALFYLAALGFGFGEQIVLAGSAVLYIMLVLVE